MEPVDLHELILAKMKELRPDVPLHPLYKAILMESCENTALLDQAKDFTEDELIVTTMRLFEMATSAFKGLVAGAAKIGDIINITYQGGTYTFDKNSPLVINALKSLDSSSEDTCLKKEGQE
jgi:hypothetical protein